MVKYRENLRFSLYMTIATSCQQSTYIETVIQRNEPENHKMAATSCQQGAYETTHASDVHTLAFSLQNLALVLPRGGILAVTP